MVVYWLKRMCISICGCYFKYYNELCYKSTVNGMFVMFSAVDIVNTAMSCVIKLHRQYILFSTFCWL